MKIYSIIRKTGMFVTASPWLAVNDDMLKDERNLAIIEWDVKTQGSNFHTWSAGRYVIDRRNK